jgi:hypothetical protein
MLPPASAASPSWKPSCTASTRARKKVLDLLQAGVIGELRMIHSAFTFRLTRPDNIR